jgi:hypothetical protein
MFGECLHARQGSVGGESTVFASVSNQQPQNRFEPNALLAHERHGVNFSTRVVIGSSKSQGDDLSRPRMRPMKAPMFLGSGLTFPLAVGAGVATDGVKVWTAAVQLAVVQYYDVDVGDA